MGKNDQGVKLQGLLRRNSQRKKYKIKYGKPSSMANHMQNASHASRTGRPIRRK